MKKIFLFFLLISSLAGYSQNPTRGSLLTLDTTYKPSFKMLAVNTLDNLVYYWNLVYWGSVGSGSGGSTWQQTLVAGSDLTQDNLSNLNQKSFTLYNTSDFIIHASNVADDTVYQLRADYAGGYAELYSTRPGGQSWVRAYTDSVSILGNLIHLRDSSIGSAATNGYVWTLVDDTDGEGTWKPQAAGWGLTGNSGTTAGTNFVGTTDAQDVVIKRNSVEQGRFRNSGLLVTATVDGGGATDGAVVIQRTLNEANGTHGFRDLTIITNDASGTANFDAQAEHGSTGNSDHMAALQARNIINKGTGILTTNWGALEITQILSPIIDNVSFQSQPYVYTGGTITNRIGLRIKEYEGSASLVSNTYGVLFDALTKATGDNFGLYDNGDNKHYLQTLILGSAATTSASGALVINSTTKGLLAPRMTAAQRAAIGSPATGLLVYQTDGAPAFYYYNGSVWTGLAQTIVGTTASSATPSPTGNAFINKYSVTALAAGATFAAPSGTPSDGNELTIFIKDNGGAQTLAFNAIYIGSTDIALPTTTVAGKGMKVKFEYCDSMTKWLLVGLTNGF